jgi:hypothetical protein
MIHGAGFSSVLPLVTAGSGRRRIRCGRIEVKSVSTADDWAHSVTVTGPVTSVSWFSGAELYTSTSERCSAGAWS